MKKIIIFVLITALMLLSCKNNTTNVDTDNNSGSTETQEELEKYAIDIDTATKENIEEALNKYYQDKGEYKVIFKGTSLKTYDGMLYGTTLSGIIKKIKLNNIIVSLEHVNFPDNKLNNYILGGWQNLNDNIVQVILPDTITTIGTGSFNCINIVNINIPKNLETIEDEAFYSIKMKELILPNGVKAIGKTSFSGCEFINILIPDSVTSIGEKAFEACRKLTKITLPNTITTLEKSVLSSCSSLQSITIPSSVTEIKDNAFYYSKVLENITFLSAAPPTIGKSVFNGTAIKNIYVPKGTKTQYEQQLKGKSGIPQTVNIVELQ
ncbi:leucine-rich repeat domain-containing protein [Brachyspira pilosicoli]|uniref:leucine-rich repeat domain-containing protein n=1 Tax=Brachyspira pilosicoli TaxID=52584 RepID=UPI003006ECE2